MTEQYKRFTIDVALAGLTEILVSMEAFLLIPIITKFLGASQYGILAQITVTVSLLSLLAPLGLGQAMVRFFVSYDNDFDKSRNFYGIFFFSLASSIIFGILIFLLSNTLATYVVKDLSSLSLIRLSGLLMIAACLNEIVLAYFNTYRQIKLRAVLLILQTVFELGMTYYLVSNGAGLFSLLLTYIIVKFLIMLVGLFLINLQVGFSWPYFGNISRYLRFSLPIASLIIFGWVIHSSDIYMLGIYHTTVNVGVYSAVYSMSKVILLFVAPIVFVLFPTISKAWDEQKFEDVKTYLGYSIKYFLLFAIPSAFGVIALGPSLLELLATKTFVSGAYLFPYVIFGLILYKLGDFFELILTSEHRTKLIGAIYGSAAILNIILNALLIPRWEMLGAAIATFISYASVFVFMLLSIRHFKFSWNVGFILKSIAASAVMAYVVRRIPVYGLVDTVIAIIAGAAVYFIIIFILQALGEDEIRFFKNFIR